MRVYLTLLWREFSAYLYSFTGYVIIGAVLFLIGASFTVMLAAYNGDSAAAPLTELFYSTMFFWLILLIATPVITMRLFAQEKFTGTFETLMTCPVGDAQVVLAKFSAAFLFYMLTWAPLLPCLLLVHRYANPGTALDPWTVAGTFLGIYLIGAAYTAMGCLASALTRSQIVAAMVSFALGLTLFLLSFLKYSLGQEAGWAGYAASYISMVEHMEDFVRGVVDTRRVTFYLSLTTLFLFLTVRVVESRRWR